MVVIVLIKHDACVGTSQAEELPLQRERQERLSGQRARLLNSSDPCCLNCPSC